MSRRIERVNELIRKELSSLLATEMNDPRLPLLVSVTHVDVSADLRQAKVYVSVMSHDEEKRSTVELLQKASGFLHRELKARVALRYVPVLSFHLDESIEKGLQMLQFMDNVQWDGSAS